MTEQRYSGWANWATWNVSLWLNNDKGLYRIARSERVDYKNLAKRLREDYDLRETPDGCAYNDSGLDTDELDKMLHKLRGEDE